MHLILGKVHPGPILAQLASVLKQQFLKVLTIFFFLRTAALIAVVVIDIE